MNEYVKINKLLKDNGFKVYSITTEFIKDSNRYDDYLILVDDGQRWTSNVVDNKPFIKTRSFVIKSIQEKQENNDKLEKLLNDNKYYFDLFKQYDNDNKIWLLLYRIKINKI